MKFEELELCSPLQKALAREWFETPTEIQEKVIPVASENKDILGCAQTGSWKTLAFVLPILDKMYKTKKMLNLEDWVGFRKIKALILAPTRELAEQIGESFKPYCTNVNFKHFTIYW
jgi:ATP-dependent RNA helicase RhlE